MTQQGEIHTWCSYHTANVKPKHFPTVSFAFPLFKAFSRKDVYLLKQQIVLGVITKNGEQVACFHRCYICFQSITEHS